MNINEITEAFANLEYTLKKNTTVDRPVVEVNLDPKVFDMIVLKLHESGLARSSFRPSEMFFMTVYGISIKPKQKT